MSDCAACGCRAESPAHPIAAALARGDVDAALEAGLLACEPCPACLAECRQRMAAARDARRVALAARERHRAREARLAERARDRAARRAQAAAASPAALPPAAAAALQRALAKARRP